MALDKNGKKLPKGITYRKNENRYMGRFMYNGQSYTTYGKTVRETVKQLEELKYEIEHKIYFKESDVIIDAWFNTWLNVYRGPHVKDGTIEVYTRTYNCYIQKTFGKRKLKDIRTDEIQKFYVSMAKKYSRNTLESCRAVLNGMFQQAVILNMIQKNPVSYARLPRDTRQRHINVMTKMGQTVFLQYAKNSRHYPMYEIALFTGMRSGELRGLQWEDIDFEKNVIHVTHSLLYLNHAYRLGETKTPNSIRDIPMLPNVRKLLKQQRRSQLIERQEMGEFWNPDTEFKNLVFTNMTGNPINRDRFKKGIDRIVNKIQKDGISFPHITPHTFRHTFATRCIEQGIPPKVLQTIMGHKDLATTMDIYTHVLPNTKAEEIEKLNALIS